MDFLTADAAGSLGMADPEVLTLAGGGSVYLSPTMSVRCLVTSAHSRLQENGVLLLPQSLEVGAAIDELLLIWLASEASSGKTGSHGCPIAMVALMTISARLGVDARPREPARRDIGCTASPEASMDRCLASVK